MNAVLAGADVAMVGLLLSPGWAREVADACRQGGVGVVVFANPLTDHQRAVLKDMFGCLVMSGEDLR
ncbi:hypothetical protein [Micromonospora ureilytica]|uniref:hypothetical protein n=1 Tax=Micromonospora ureilytica TaxID=709868 RepID=UPI002E1616A6|nr:hypothetical protein OHB55_01670 [Micromonospora ureilytica]